MFVQKNVVRVEYNWHQYRDGCEAGENMYTYEIGKRGCIDLKVFTHEHQLLVRAEFDNGNTEIQGNINKIIYGSTIK